MSVHVTVLVKFKEESRTVDVPSQEQDVFLNQDDIFYNTHDPLTFSSQSTVATASHDPSMTPTNNGHMTLIDVFGMSITNQMEKPQLIQTVSIPLNQEMGAGLEGSSSSPPVPKQQKSIPKMFSCNICQEQFNTRSELNTHRASHTGDSPVTCNMCDKVFVSKNTLAIHMRIHTGVKPYVCLLCGKRFTQNGGLRIHLRTHSGEKPFTCEVCQTSFNNPSNLRRHMVTHNTGFKCLICKKIYSSKYTAVEHTFMHTGETPFKCGLCSQAFSQRNHLSIHRRKHHGVVIRKVIKCACSRRFYVKSKYKEHKLICSKAGK
uniref:C2H2-type domain-containing protein n=1 Tax=Neogobius melanostomus TaxID=47308 RepID=A0A8C6TFB3_9GOBI